MANVYTAIVHMNRSFQSVMKVVRNYAEAFILDYDVSFTETRINNIFQDIIPLLYLPIQSRSSYIRYVRVRSLMAKNADATPLLESRNEGRDSENELEISHLERKMFYATRAGIVVLNIETTDVYIANPIASTVFHAPRFCRLGKQLQKKLYDLLEQFNNLVKRSFLGFMNGKLAEVSTKGRSVKPLYLHDM